MSEKKYPKITISLKKEDEAELLKLRAHYEAVYLKQFSLADVVRQCMRDANSSMLPALKV